MFAGLMQRSVLRSPAAVIAAVARAFDPALKSADFSISGGGLTATRSSQPNYIGVIRASPAMHNGEFSITITTLAGACSIGWEDGTTDPTQYGFVGQENGWHGVGYQSDGTIRGGSNTPVSGLPTYGQGDTIRCVIAQPIMTFYKNGTLAGSIDTTNITFGGSSGNPASTAALYPIITDGNNLGAVYNGVFP